ncbi:hypothetical protein ANO11243_001020 [Dothideomycetidae sp. 11243]|nr:hypothetical protein ANO11243_001020 [fungal sp. No.11243]
MTISVTARDTSEPSADQRWMGAPLPESRKNNAHTRYRLYTSEHFSDCAIKLESKTKKLHALILAQACPYFASFFFGTNAELARGQSPQELGLKETTDRTLDLSSEDESLVEKMLKYIYLFDDAEVFPARAPKDPYWIQGVLYFSLAVRFGVVQLKAEIHDRLLQATKTKWDFDALVKLATAVSLLDASAEAGGTALSSLVMNVVTSHSGKVKSLSDDQHQALLRVAPYTAPLILQHLQAKLKKLDVYAKYKCANNHCRKEFPFFAQFPGGSKPVCSFCGSKKQHIRLT